MESKSWTLIPRPLDVVVTKEECGTMTEDFPVIEYRTASRGNRKTSADDGVDLVINFEFHRRKAEEEKVNAYYTENDLHLRKKWHEINKKNDDNIRKIIQQNLMLADVKRMKDDDLYNMGADEIQDLFNSLKSSVTEESLGLNGPEEVAEVDEEKMDPEELRKKFVNEVTVTGSQGDQLERTSDVNKSQSSGSLYDTFIADKTDDEERKDSQEIGELATWPNPSNYEEDSGIYMPTAEKRSTSPRKQNEDSLDSVNRTNLNEDPELLSDEIKMKENKVVSEGYLQVEEDAAVSCADGNASSSCHSMASSVANRMVTHQNSLKPLKERSVTSHPKMTPVKPKSADQAKVTHRITKKQMRSEIKIRTEPNFRNSRSQSIRKSPPVEQAGQCHSKDTNKKIKEKACNKEKLAVTKFPKFPNLNEKNQNGNFVKEKLDNQDQEPMPVLPAIERKSKSYNSVHENFNLKTPNEQTFYEVCTKGSCKRLKHSRSDTLEYNIRFVGSDLFESSIHGDDLDSGVQDFTNPVSEEKFFDAEPHPSGFKERVEEIIENYINNRFISLHKDKDYELIIVPKNRSYLLRSYAGKIMNRRRYVPSRFGNIPEISLRRTISGRRRLRKDLYCDELSGSSEFEPKSETIHSRSETEAVSDISVDLKQASLEGETRNFSLTKQEENKLEETKRNREEVKDSFEIKMPVRKKEVRIKTNEETKEVSQLKNSEDIITSSEIFAELDKFKSMFREVEKKHDNIFSFFCNDPCGLSHIDQSTTFDPKVNILIK